RASARVLISLVGDSDPRPSTGEDGNILAIAAAHLPDAVYLMYTADAKYSTRMSQVTDALRALNARIEVIPMPLEGVTDPTDFAQFSYPLRDRTSEALEQISSRWNPEEPAVFVNVTSGSPQMRLVLHMFVEQEIPPARRLQVARPEFAGPAARVR